MPCVGGGYGFSGKAPTPVIPPLSRVRPDRVSSLPSAHSFSHRLCSTNSVCVSSSFHFLGMPASRCNQKSSSLSTILLDNHSYPDPHSLFPGKAASASISSRRRKSILFHCSCHCRAVSLRASRSLSLNSFICLDASGRELDGAPSEHVSPSVISQDGSPCRLIHLLKPSLRLHSSRGEEEYSGAPVAHIFKVHFSVGTMLIKQTVPLDAPLIFQKNCKRSLRLSWLSGSHVS